MKEREEAVEEMEQEIQEGALSEAKGPAGQPVVQRSNPPPDSQALTDLLAMTVKEFHDHIRANPRWLSTLSRRERRRIRRISNLMTNSFVEVCQDLPMFFLDLQLNPAGTENNRKIRYLQAYVRGVKGQILNGDGQSLKKTMVFEALEIGKDLLAVKDGIPSYITRNAFEADAFISLHNGGYIEDLVRYYRRVRPIFQSPKDFTAYYEFRATDNGDPLDYHRGKVRENMLNYHRFHKTTMDAIQANYNDTSKSKPLTLILHSGVDHNGAFIRDAGIPPVATNGSILTLMIEGQSSLSQIRGKIRPLARQYGQNRRIAQVMFAGHGNARLMEMSGGISRGRGGTIRQTGQDLDLDSRRGRQLINTVIANMESPSAADVLNGPHGRIIFNACLTNSYDAAKAVRNGDIDATAAAVNRYITTHPNLREYVEARARATGRGNIRVMGANASTYAGLDFINPATGGLEFGTTNYTSDHASAVGDKLTYVEFGREFTGLTRAVVSEWARDQAACLDAMNRRIARAATDDAEHLIKGAYRAIVNHYSNSVRSIAYVLGHMESIHGGDPDLNVKTTVNTLEGNNWRGYYGNVVMGLLFDGFRATDSYGNYSGPRIVYHQVWSDFNAAKRAQLMTDIGSLTCEEADEFVHIGYLDSKGLIGPLLTGGYSENGKIVLAILALAGNPAQADAITFLRGKLDAANQFPAAMGIAGKLGALMTEAELHALVDPPAPPPAGP